MSGTATSVLVALLLVVSSRESSAAPRFQVRSWQSEDGLPSNVVRSVVQAADGYLWVATAEGVVRFDGVRFSGFAEEPEAMLAQRPARALFALPSGEVWIATARGGLLRWDGRCLRSVWEETETAVPASRIPQVTQVVSDGGAGAFIERADEVYHHGGGKGLPRRLERTAALAAKLHATEQAQAQRSSTAPAGASLELRDRHGRLWTASPADGLAVAEGVIETVPLPGFGRGSRITALCEGREGDLWVGTGGNGLCQVRPRRANVFGLAEGLSERTVFALLEDQSGALWAANKSGGLDRIAGGQVTHFEAGDGGANRPISALCEDRGGTLWAATRNGSVFRWQDGIFRIATGSAMPVTKVLAMVEDKQGRLWFGGQQGLAAWHGDALTRYGAEQGIPSQDVTALALDPSGTLWVGTGDGSLFCGGGGGRFEQRGKANAAGGRAVSALLPDADGSVWIATLGAGLFHWQSSRVTQFSGPEGLPEKRLTCVLDDGSGHLWIGSLAGIFRVEKAELAEVAAGRRAAANWILLDRSDGLLSRECTGGFQPAGWRGRDGSLWFPTVNGIATVRPAELELNTVPPPVAIEEARANGQGIARGSAVLRTGPGRSRLEFRYTALSFSAPEKVRFRLQLEGLEGSGWREVGGQRAAAWEAVPPGRYRFRVCAANGDGVWNEAGASLAVEVLPHVWETAWFRASIAVLAVALAIGMGWGIARVRMRSRLLRLELQTTREKERARIAQDLHDDLGASLTEISMLAHLAVEETKETRGRDPLPEIAAKAHGLVGALDEIVWAVNPRHDTLVSLADYLAGFAAEFLETAGIALRLDIPRDLPQMALDAEQRHELFLATREALNNAVKHSGASEVWLRFSIAVAELRIAVEDNGHGLSIGVSELSEGLLNMRERMMRIGGTCRIESSADGTGVCFTLPLQE